MSFDVNLEQADFCLRVIKAVIEANGLYLNKVSCRFFGFSGKAYPGGSPVAMEFIGDLKFSGTGCFRDSTVIDLNSAKPGAGLP